MPRTKQQPQPPQPPTEKPAGLHFIIDDVGGIEHAELDLVPGRLNRLHGRNGAGKTTAALAVLRSLGAAGVELEVRDGAVLGTVQGAGTKTVVPAQGRVRQSGEPPITPDDLKALTDLVTGRNLVGDDERNRARIDAFLRITRPRIDEAAISLLCERDTEMTEWLSELVRSAAVSDLLGASKALQKELQRRAREREEAAQQWLGQADAERKAAREAMERLEEIGGRVEEPQPAAAAAAHETAVRLLERTTAGAAERKRIEELQGKARAVATKKPDVPAAEQRLEAKVAECASLRARIEDLKRVLSEAEAALATACRDQALARADLTTAKSDLESWTRLQGILEQAVEGPTDVEVAAAEAAVAQARQSQEAHQVSAALLKSEADARAAQDKSKLEGDRGQQLREWSTAVHQRLADVLSQQGIEGWTVVDGRLSVQVGDAVRDFDRRMSPGEKISAAVTLAAPRFHGVAYFDQDVWLKMDDENKAALEQLAVDRPDLILIVEESDAGELRVE